MIKVSRFFNTSSYKHMERYFEEMAAKGLMIKKIGKFFFKFEEVNPVNLEFSVTTSMTRSWFSLDANEDDDQMREMSELSGWHFVTAKQVYNVFCKPKDLDVPSLHTDEELEFKQFKKNYWKTDGTQLIMFIFLLLQSIYFLSSIGLMMDGGNIASVFLLNLLMVATFLITYSIPQFYYYLLNSKRVKKGDDLLLPSYEKEYKKSSFDAFILCFFLIIYALALGFLFSKQTLYVVISMVGVMVVSTYIIRKFRLSNFKSFVLVMISVFAIISINTGIIMSKVSLEMPKTNNGYDYKYPELIGNSEILSFNLDSSLFYSTFYEIDFEDEHSLYRTSYYESRLSFVHDLSLNEMIEQYKYIEFKSIVREDVTYFIAKISNENYLIIIDEGNSLYRINVWYEKKDSLTEELKEIIDLYK